MVVTKNGACRSLVANLAAANHFTKAHIELPENKQLIDNAKFYYISVRYSYSIVLCTVFINFKMSRNAIE